MAYESYESFESVKGRLDEIVDAVSDDALPLDQALSLYEEAVGLGLRASDLLEQGIDAKRAEQALAQADAQQDGTEAAAAGAGQHAQGAQPAAQTVDAGEGVPHEEREAHA